MNYAGCRRQIGDYRDLHVVQLRDGDSIGARDTAQADDR